MKHKLLAFVTTGAIAGAALGGSLAVAADGTMPVASKFALEGKIIQGDGVGKNGETFALIYEETGTGSANGPDHKMHCLGVIQGGAGSIVEQHGYCIETDPDGDQVMWKVTPAAHLMTAPTTLAVHEAFAGTGKYSGIALKLNSTYQLSDSSPAGYKLKCEFTP